MKLFLRIFTLGLLFALSVGEVYALMPVEKSQVIVFINGKKFYVHTVKQGDTLYSLAKAYDVSEGVISQNNPAASDGLKIDQTLKIPVPDSALEAAKKEKKRKKDFLTHKIKAGQTLYAIARDYNISVADLMEDNPTINPQSLPVGQTLWVRRAKIGSSSESEVKAEIAEYTDNLNRATADDGYEHYVVQAGETVYSLSRRFGITEQEFAQLNDLSGGLKAGAMIRVPQSKSEGADAGATENEISGPVAEVALRALDKSDRLDIAMMLPMNIDSRPNASYVEFYQGFLLGLEKLKGDTRSGETKLTVYNTGHDQLKVEQIVKSTMFEGTDLVVGPVYEDELNPVLRYAEHNSVPVVSPLANLSAVESPALYQLSPNTDRKYDKISDLVDGSRDIYMVYASSYDEEFEQEMKSVLHGRPYMSYTYSFDDQKSVFTPRTPETPVIETIDTVMKAERPCLFVVLASGETDVDRILGTLSSAKVALTERSAASSEYVVLGTSRWGRFSNIDHTTYFNNNVVMISTYHAKRDSQAVREFDSRYIESYGSLPSLYAYRGYDTAIIFAGGMRGDMDYSMMDKRYTPLQTTYKFDRKDDKSKYVNQEWVRVSYNSNYTITIK